tara:strand:- start:103 stop:477 length:375 start_codon:yes stop_codon:yes gene_type:complete
MIHFIFGEKCKNLNNIQLTVENETSLTLQGGSSNINLSKGSCKPLFTSVTLQDHYGDYIYLDDIIRIDRLTLINCSSLSFLSNHKSLFVGHIELINSSVDGIEIIAETGFRCDKSKGEVSILFP